MSDDGKAMTDDPIIRAMQGVRTQSDAFAMHSTLGMHVSAELLQAALRAALEATGYVHNPSRSYQASMPPKLIRTAYGDIQTVEE